MRTYEYAYLWRPGIEVAEETVAASRNASALLNFAPHPIGSPARGAGSFAAEGLNLSANQAYHPEIHLCFPILLAE